MRFLAIDFETANIKADSACSVGLVLVEDFQIVHKESHFIRPPYKNDDWEFTEIHGLTYEDVASAPNFNELWPKIQHLFQHVDYIAAHNASFDSNVLYSTAHYFGMELPQFEFRCTMKIAMNELNFYPYNLAYVCKILNIPLNHHEAMSDATACAQIMLYALKLKNALI